MLVTLLNGWCIGLAGMVLANGTLADEPQSAPHPIVLKAAHIFDSVSGKLEEPGVVVVAGSRIQAVASNARIPDDAKVVDLGDATLMPGFIDAHVHLSSEMS